MNNTELPKRKPRCQFISKIGVRCHADPQTGKDYCFFHDPDQKKKQAEARKQGGEARSRQTEPELTLPPNLPAVSLQKAGDVYALMNETVHQLQCRKMDVRAAQAIAYLASLVLRALKAGLPFLAKLLSDTITEVRRGQTDLRTAKTMGHLTSIMLTALKQEAQEREEQARMEAIRPARPAEAMRADSSNQAPRPESIEAVVSLIATAKPLDDHKPHPAVTTAATANAAHAEARHA
jgi:hypothetical protein